MHDEIEHRIPAAPPHGEELAAIKASLARIEHVLIGDPFDPKGPPGLVRQQNVHGEQLMDHEQRIIKLEEDIPTRTQLRSEFTGHGDRLAKLEERGEKDREKAGDRWLGLLLDLLKTIGGGIAGAYLASKGGPHP